MIQNFRCLFRSSKLSALRVRFICSFNPRPVRAFLITRTVRGGVGTTPPPGDRPLMVVELRGKDQSMRLDEISRLHILFLVLGQYLT